MSHTAENPRVGISRETITPASIADVQEVVARGMPVSIRGNDTKPSLHAADASVQQLDMRTLSGILEYEPGEYTITALAGTPLFLVRTALREHGQYLPFDPPLVDAGATLGGTIAAGLSGSGRQRYGGVRDFLIGIRYVDGLGRLVRGGGKVVKNAAGFDLPKLMVGSLGQLGVLVEVSFKVFPQPPAYATLQVDVEGTEAAFAGLGALARLPLDLEAADIVTGDGAALLLRLGGLPATLSERIARLQAVVGTGHVYTESAEAELWQSAGEFGWAHGPALVKVPLAPGKVVEFDARLATAGAARRYAAAGHLAWVSPADDPVELVSVLTEFGLNGLVLRGGARPFLGHFAGSALFERVKKTLDPHGVFPNFID